LGIVLVEFSVQIVFVICRQTRGLKRDRSLVLPKIRLCTNDHLTFINGARTMPKASDEITKMPQASVMGLFILRLGHRIYVSNLERGT
jgi:hypothetical protein